MYFEVKVLFYSSLFFVSKNIEAHTSTVIYVK